MTKVRKHLIYLTYEARVKPLPIDFLKHATRVIGLTDSTMTLKKSPYALLFGAQMFTYSAL